MGTLPHHTGNVSVGYCGTISVVFVRPFLYAVCDACVPVHVANVLLLLLLLWHFRFSAIRLQLNRCFCVFAVLFTIWPWIVLLNIQSKGACCICLVLSCLGLAWLVFYFRMHNFSLRCAAYQCVMMCRHRCRFLHHLHIFFFLPSFCQHFFIQNLLGFRVQCWCCMRTNYVNCNTSAISYLKPFFQRI